MAGCTVTGRIILFVEIAFMDIFMTIGAADADLPEIPFLSLLVTGKAGCRQVRSFKLEPALVVLFNGKRKLVKPFCAVADRTICHNAIPDELLVVIIFVTICAKVVF